MAERAAREHAAADRPVVVVVGSVNVDLVVRVDRLPVAGETVNGGVFSRHHGGKSANQAVAAARMGAWVRFVGAIGDDEMGDSARAALVREGIDVSGVHVAAGAPTGVASIVVDAAGENQIAVASGANARLGATWVDQALASQADAPGVVLLSLEVDDEPLLAAARHARAKGLRLIVNVAPARPVPQDLLEQASVIVANLGEAEQLSGTVGPEGPAIAIARATGAAVVVTLGSGGALIAQGDVIERVAGFQVDAIDATGAGDTVAGVIAAELAADRPLVAAVRMAMAAAALSVTVEGAREGMPDRRAVEAFAATAEGGIRSGRSPRG